MADLHVRVDDALVEAARRRAPLPEDMSRAAVVRFAMAQLAGWPRDRAQQAARGWNRRIGEPAGCSPERTQ